MYKAQFSSSYNIDDNTLNILNHATGMVYESYIINPSTLNKWSGQEEAETYALERIKMINATSPAAAVVSFIVTILDINNNYTPCDIIKKDNTYRIQLAAISNAVLVDFDHAGVLLECKTPAGNKMYNIPFQDGIGFIDLAFTDSGIYTFELDSLRDAASKQLLSDIYPNINNPTDLIIAVTDN